MSESRRPIRVLHLRDSPWVDGPGRTILDTATELDRSRIDFHIGVLVDGANATHPLVSQALHRGLKVHGLPDRQGLNWDLRRQIQSLVRDLQVDIVHTSDIRTNLFASLASLPSHVRRVATAHGWIANTPRRRTMRLLDKAMMRRLDLAIFVSAATSSLVPQWWLPDSRRVVLPNALVLDAWDGCGAGTPDSSAGVTIASIGRLSVEKGHELLLPALAELIREYPDLRLKIAGTGPEEKRLRAQAAALGVSGHVEFLGYVQDMRPVYSASDLVVQSSRTEGMPNVVLEAAAMGVPVVATAVGGTSEIIRHGHSGWLVPPDDATALTAGIRHFLGHREFFRQMATRAREYVVTYHSITFRTECLTVLYEELAGRRRK